MEALGVQRISLETAGFFAFFSARIKGRWENNASLTYQ